MKRDRLTLLQVVALALLAACAQPKSTPRAEAEVFDEEPLPERFENDDMPKAADELFEDFMYYFASNERLQRRRIAFPVEQVVHDDSIRLIDAEQWQMDPFFMEAGQYTLILDSQEQRELQNDSNVNNVVVEKIFLATDSISQYLFRRVEGRWMLSQIRPQTVSDNPNASFLKFYYQFANDSAFQQQSLCSEIAFSGPDPDDDFAQMDGFITPDSWGAFAPELPRDSIYNIVYEGQDSRSREKSFLICGISNGSEAELTFQQRKGKWKLARLTE